MEKLIYSRVSTAQLQTSCPSTQVPVVQSVALVRLVLSKTPTVTLAVEILKDVMWQILVAPPSGLVLTMPEGGHTRWSGLHPPFKSGTFLVAQLLAIFSEPILIQLDGELQSPISREDVTLTPILPTIKSLST